MTKSQKIITAFLSAMALIVLAGACVAFGFLFLSPPSIQPVAQAEATVTTPAYLPSPSYTPSPAPSSPPTQVPFPTPTGTRVVVVTVLPTPSPTRANCVDKVQHFESSGLLDNEQVQQYLRETIPVNHLDNCRSIEYVPQYAENHGVAISGNITPVYRHIFVYATNPNQNTEDILDTLIHEIGHNVHMNIRRENQDLFKQWIELHNQSLESYGHNGTGFFSDYARVDKFEDFAESYLAYIKYPATLQFYSQQKYNFMKQHIFQGQEYSP